MVDRIDRGHEESLILNTDVLWSKSLDLICIIYHVLYDSLYKIDKSSSKEYFLF